MPNWLNYIADIVGPAQDGWLSVSDIQTRCKSKHKDAVARNNPGRASSITTWPKPSVPMIQATLVRMISARTVVAKKGSYGAAHFAHLGALRAGTIRCYTLHEPREYRLRSECRSFNSSVDQAISNNTALPNPWNTRSANATLPRDPNAPAPSQVFDGPLAIPEETLNIVTRLLEVRNTRNWSDEMNHFVRNNQGSIREIFETLSPELRGLIQITDIREILMAAREALVTKAQERLASAPKNLEEDYYDRLRAKGETID